MKTHTKLDMSQYEQQHKNLVANHSDWIEHTENCIQIKKKELEEQIQLLEKLKKRIFCFGSNLVIRDFAFNKAVVVLPDPGPPKTKALPECSNNCICKSSGKDIPIHFL